MWIRYAEYLQNFIDLRILIHSSKDTVQMKEIDKTCKTITINESVVYVNLQMEADRGYSYDALLVN